MDFKYVCTDCGKEYPSGSLMYLCPECESRQSEGFFQKGILKTLLDKSALKEVAQGENFSPLDFLPYSIPHPQTYSVGNTPLTAPMRLRKNSGFTNLYLKNDGANPSGSLKDRASQLVAAQAIHNGENRVVLASTGNAGSAMACAGAAYGLEIVLFVPETAPKAKILQSVLYGAKVIPVKGTYDDAYELSIEFSQKRGGINRNTAFNPMTIEGKKTVSLELYAQLGNKAPDTVIVPTGDGVILSGVYKGFYDLKEAGLIEKIPRIICAQAEKSNAISAAFNTGEMKALAKADTRADSISVASPANGRMAVENIRDSGGWAVEVSDDEITRAQLALCEETGIFSEPAAAAAYAGFVKTKDRLDKEETVVVLLTGIGFKDLRAVEEAVTFPASVEPDMGKIIEYLER